MKLRGIYKTKKAIISPLIFWIGNDEWNYFGELSVVSAPSVAFHKSGKETTGDFLLPVEFME